MIGLQVYPKHREQILAQQAEDTLVLLNLDSGEYYALEEVGGRIWCLCDGTRSVSEIISTLCEEYDAPSDKVRADAMELIGDMFNESLLVEANRAARYSEASGL
jgi:Coenzyme PQQ synthesis protein D (PqqD)